VLVLRQLSFALVNQRFEPHVKPLVKLEGLLEISVGTEFVSQAQAGPAAVGISKPAEDQAQWPDHSLAARL
jgi:hypothetical protein